MITHNSVVGDSCHKLSAAIMYTVFTDVMIDIVLYINDSFPLDNIHGLFIRQSLNGV